MGVGSWGGTWVSPSRGSGGYFSNKRKKVRTPYMTYPQTQEQKDANSKRILVDLNIMKETDNLTDVIGERTPVVAKLTMFEKLEKMFDKIFGF